MLDNRASTLLKLDDLPNALKDGKRMITLGKTQTKVSNALLLNPDTTTDKKIKGLPSDRPGVAKDGKL